MKIRNGFVSNSSSSSFICNVCGQEYEGWDACPSDPEFKCSECEVGHVMCNEHLKNIKMKPIKTKGCEHEFDREKAKFCTECGKESWLENENAGYTEDAYLSSEYCPICRFKLYDEEEMASYLEKTRKISRDEVFAKVKAINKRRKKLYESEYITHVCEKFSLNDNILLKEIKDKFGTHTKYMQFINKE